MSKVNSQMIKEVIEEIGVGEKFPYKTEEEKEEFYSEVAQKLNETFETLDFRLTLRFTNFLTRNGINPTKFNDVIEAKYKVYSLERESSKEDQEPEQEPEQEKRTDVDIKTLADLIWKQTEISFFYQEPVISESSEKDESLKKADSPNLRKASTPYAATKSSTQVVSDLVESQRYSETDLKSSRRIYEIRKMAKIANESAEKRKPLIGKKAKRNVKLFGNSPRGKAEKLKYSAESVKKEETKRLIDTLKEFSKKILGQARMACIQKEVKQTRTKIGLQLEEIRNQDPIDDEKLNELRKKVVQERENQISRLRDALDDIQTLKVKVDLSNFRFSPDRVKDIEDDALSDDEIEEIIYGKEFLRKPLISLNNDGSLKLSDSRLKLEDLQDSPLGEKLYTELRLLATMPRIVDLTDTEVLQLAHSMGFNNGKININFSRLNDNKVPGDRSWYDKERTTKIPDKSKDKETKNAVKAFRECRCKLQYMRNLNGELFYDKVQEEYFRKVCASKEELGTYDRILLELDALENLRVCGDFATHVADLEDRYSIVTNEDRKSSFDERDRKALRNLKEVAQTEVDEFGRSGINIIDVIENDKSDEAKTIKKGEQVLEQYDKSVVESALRKGEKKDKKVDDDFYID